ncbi:MAG: hypothetical protein IJ242_07940 [Clostridia bacterium]|nr:hypothetical protein [Clostridia bacterium]
MEPTNLIATLMFLIIISLILLKSASVVSKQRLPYFRLAGAGILVLCVVETGTALFLSSMQIPLDLITLIIASALLFVCILAKVPESGTIYQRILAARFQCLAVSVITVVSAALILFRIPASRFLLSTLYLCLYMSACDKVINLDPMTKLNNKKVL